VTAAARRATLSARAAADAIGSSTMWNADRYKQALDFAARAHGEQKVPGTGAPYVVHLCKVAMEVQCVVAFAVAKDPSFDVDLAVTAALLHDCIEDAGVAADDVEAHFGRAVRDAVVALTKDAALPSDERMPDALRRIRAQPRAVWAVKLADRITNLESPPPHWTLEKRRRYRAEAVTIRETLRGGCAPLEERLEEKIAAYAPFCA
jgi:guanosine-3',5'-bis(diphosphate) 3'-pyrophosphohydrolase